VDLELLPDQLVGIIVVMLLRWGGKGLLPGVVSGSDTHMERIQSSSLNIDMLEIDIIEKRDNLLNVLTLFELPIFEWN
jgi:hypothetical protein